MIGDGLLPTSSSDDKRFLEVLLNYATSCKLSASAISFTISAAVTSFTVSASNSYSKDPSKAKTNSGYEGDRRHSVSRLRSPMLFRYKSIKGRNETQYILPDGLTAYSSRAITYLLEVNGMKPKSEELKRKQVGVHSILSTLANILRLVVMKR